jgi:DMSO/TMAO reductase YedYZ molybdopterin-dependent catalytic subunit
MGAMGFFDRNRKELEKLGVSPDRLPPGQYYTERFPVLHAGSVPIYKDLTGWDLRVSGLVNEPRTLRWDDVLALPAADVVVDIHCVTKWSKFDTTWRGVPIETILDLVGVQPSATHVMWHSEHGFTANVPLEDVLGTDEKGQPRCLLAYQYGGDPLEPDHGYPMRAFVPHLYFWKSAKWLRGIELMDGDRPGFWERNGYHMYGDPFREQRFWGD